MKRLLTLMISAALLLACASAAADNPAAEFEDFTLKAKAALVYAGLKAEGQPLFVFYHTVTGEISTSAVNAVWLSSAEPVSADEFTSMLQSAETAMCAQQESKGNTLKRYQVMETVEKELWGKAVLVCDTEMLVGLSNADIYIIQRSIRTTDIFGTYIFSISAFSKKSLEETTDELVNAVQWKD